MNLSGVQVRPDQARGLASLLDADELADKLERGMANGNSIVALSHDDRKRIVDVLGPHPPSGLAELRSVLVTQLKKHKELEAQQTRTRLNQRMIQRRRERGTWPAATDAANE